MIAFVIQLRRGFRKNVALAETSFEKERHFLANHKFPFTQQYDGVEANRKWGRMLSPLSSAGNNALAKKQLVLPLLVIG